MKRAFSWAILVVTSLLWVAAGLGWVAQEEPKIVLHLSIAAIWLTALDALWIAKNDEE